MLFFFVLLCWFPFVKFLATQLFPSFYSSYAYMQYLAVTGGFGVDWPSDVKATLSAFGIVNFNLQMTGMECMCAKNACQCSGTNLHDYRGTQSK
jgi:hypothetical protein